MNEPKKRGRPSKQPIVQSPERVQETPVLKAPEKVTQVSMEAQLPYTIEDLEADLDNELARCVTRMRLNKSECRYEINLDERTIHFYGGPTVISCQTLSQKPSNIINACRAHYCAFGMKKEQTFDDAYIAEITEAAEERAYERIAAKLRERGIEL